MSHEPTIQLRASRLIVAGGERAGMLDFKRRDFRAAKAMRHPPLADRSSPTMAEEGLEHADLSRRTVENAAQMGEVLPKQYFLRQLKREKRRADRSKAPLSIALFRFEGESSGAAGDVQRLVELLCDRKRETDILGFLGDNLIAILLTDTNAAGTQAFMQKVAHRAHDLRFSSSAGTYPDHLFDTVSAGTPDAAGFHPLFLDDPADPRAFGYPIKRLLDIVGALFALILLSPIMLATAIAVATSSHGPIIFKQKRLGRRGEPFVFYKFRSMYTNTDDRIHREFVSSLILGDHDTINQGDKSKPRYKMKSDPRITRVGKFIRKTSFDELPQLFNVLKGDMSLVGPRPALLYEVEKYQSWHLRRVLEMRPGITGLWQVEGRSKTTFDEMVRLDLRYIRDCSFWFDINLLFRTVKVVVKREGAG